MKRSGSVLILSGTIFPVGWRVITICNFQSFANMSSDSELSSEDHDYSSDSQVDGSGDRTNEYGLEQLGLEPYQFEPEYSSSNENETEQQRGGGQVMHDDETVENRLENSNW